MTRTYAATEPLRSDIDALAGPALVEFGTAWCGHCIAAQRLIEAAFADHPDMRHIKIEDGPGRPLGRSFGVRLWPTLVFLRGGEEIGRLVRPADAESIAREIARVDAAASGASASVPHPAPHGPADRL